MEYVQRNALVTMGNIDYELKFIPCPPGVYNTVSELTNNNKLYIHYEK